MRFQPVIKRIVPFAAAMAAGVFAAGLFIEGGPLTPVTGVPAEMQCFGHGHPVPCKDLLSSPGGSGDGVNRETESVNEAVKPESPGTRALKILSKPRPNYTDYARQNNIRGDVTLRVTFMASGQIGVITAVKGLSHGLTEQAIAAARSIRFEPATKDGTPYTITRTVQYSFSIY